MMMHRGMEILSPASYIRNSSWVFDESRRAKWTAEENKRFENALALFDKDTPDRWYNVAAMLPGKTINDIIKHYNELVADVSDIEAGLIPLPPNSANFTLDCWVTHQHAFDGLKQLYGPGSKRASSTRSSDHERKKGIPWTEEEHRQFLLGLKKYGKGDWRNISRNFVTTRTPTQVASHAQKYFIRQLSGGKDKRRSSIHDITTVTLEDTKSISPDKKGSLSPHQSTAILQLSDVNTSIPKPSLYNYGLQNQKPGATIRAPNGYLNKTHLYGTPPVFEPFQGMNSHGLQLGYNMYFQM